MSTHWATRNGIGQTCTCPAGDDHDRAGNPTARTAGPADTVPTGAEFTHPDDIDLDEILAELGSDANRVADQLTAEIRRHRGHRSKLAAGLDRIRRGDQPTDAEYHAFGARGAKADGQAIAHGTLAEVGLSTTGTTGPPPDGDLVRADETTGGGKREEGAGWFACAGDNLVDGPYGTRERAEYRLAWLEGEPGDLEVVYGRLDERRVFTELPAPDGATRDAAADGGDR